MDYFLLDHTMYTFIYLRISICTFYGDFYNFFSFGLDFNFRFHFIVIFMR